MTEFSEGVGAEDNSPFTQPIEHSEVQQVEQFDVHGFSSLESETANLIRRGLMQLPITGDYKALLNLMKNTKKLSPWWAHMNRGSSLSNQAGMIISDLWEKRLTDEWGGENPLIVLLSKLKQQYANDPAISENQVVQELFRKVPDVWWKEEE